MIRTQALDNFYYHDLLPAIRNCAQPTHVTIPTVPTLAECLNNQPALAFAHACLIPRGDDRTRREQERQVFDVYSTSREWLDHPASSLIEHVARFNHRNGPHNQLVGYLLVQNADLSFLWPSDACPAPPTLLPLPDAPWRQTTFIWNLRDAHVHPHSDSRFAWLLNLVGMRTVYLAPTWDPETKPLDSTLPDWNHPNAWIPVPLLPGQAVWIDRFRPHWVDIRPASFAVCIDMPVRPTIPVPDWFWLRPDAVIPRPPRVRRGANDAGGRQESRSRVALAPKRPGRMRRDSGRTQVAERMSREDVRTRPASLNVRQQAGFRRPVGMLSAACVFI